MAPSETVDRAPHRGPPERAQQRPICAPQAPSARWYRAVS